ncbi:MAG: cobaltochelatase subunit CobN [Paracoccaceae bacterium]|nr:cobaltochelatase subunit CobN [Paracoccaceae bacterium]MDG1370563.1 cobaltochelatase subunit CobN [Paracoccaceae bacterium]
MHLLQAQPGEISDGAEPVDASQTPADIIFISAADTELAALSEARAMLAEGSFDQSLRLANLNWLAHPYSVDLYIENTALKSRIVVARILGGEGYWPYGLEQFAARLSEAGVMFVALPGDDKPDEALFRASTVDRETWEALWAYFVEGGPENAANFLRYCDHALNGAEAPEAARPLLRAGVYWPGETAANLAKVRESWTDGAPVVPIVFYRALLQGAGLQPVNRLVRSLLREGMNPLPIFVASLKDQVSAATLASIFAEAPPAVVLNATSFAVSSPDPATWNGDQPSTPLDEPGAPVMQIIFSAANEESWAEGERGLSARDIAMNVALPEVDGRLLTRAVSFKGEAYRDEVTECPITAYRARGDRIAFVASLAANWARIGAKANADKRVALILANYPNKDGRLANGVGLDTPAATIGTLKALAEAGFQVENAPPDSAALMTEITAGPTNWLTDRAQRTGGERMSLEAYSETYKALPYNTRQRIEDRWGAPETDPFVEDGAFALSILRHGNAVVGVQPARGYNIDPKDTYHAPDLVPPHNYLAFYFWLRHEFGADAMVHMGKHGNLEWLPGKAVALSEECLPEAVFGPTPHLYPFIVNDPGEGTQAKRRTQAVIIDHLTPPMTRAETYGPLKDLEALVDEYYEASGVDPRRLEHLRKEILSLTSATGMDLDAGIGEDDDADSRLAKLDKYLCELKESQIRDGLHVFGKAPTGDQERDLAIALLRAPRADGKGGDASLIRALAVDCGVTIDPLDCEMAAAYEGPRHKFLHSMGVETWRSNGDTVERLEQLAIQAVQWTETPEHFKATGEVLETLHASVFPNLRQTGEAEIGALLTGLNGRFIPPGPSGAPTRGRLDVLPTGRNFFSVDSRAVPTPTAWALGWKSASLLIERYLQDHGDWPTTMALTAWGTANMRTGGDDIAQCLALMGVRPTWDNASRRVTGFEIMPLSVLARPRVDVTLRVSGFFRDAFPGLIDLVDSAARAVMQLDEPADQNPAAARYRSEDGVHKGARVFGSKPGAYGAGLQAMIDERLWKDKADLADAYLEWGGYAYGGGIEGDEAKEAFAGRLSKVQAVVQNQDNREHDLLDSDDYYQFEGGMAATVETLKGEAPTSYHNDNSRPERPVIRALDEEIGRVIRSRVVNPKWIDGVKRHGYKGAFEMAATVDYLFAFSATTNAVKNHHFDLVHQAYLEDDATREFIEDANPAALREMAERFQEAIDRGLWTPRSNSARALIERLRA